MVTVRSVERAHTLTVTGIVSTGGREETPSSRRSRLRRNLAGPSQQLSPPAGECSDQAGGRVLPERDPSKMTPADYDRWYCSPYISSISHQMQQELPGIEVRAIRQVPREKVESSRGWAA